MCRVAEIVRDVVDGRAELFRASAEREAAAEPPEDSVTLPSDLEGEGEETRQYHYLYNPTVIQYNT